MLYRRGEEEAENEPEQDEEEPACVGELGSEPGHVSSYLLAHMFLKGVNSLIEK